MRLEPLLNASPVVQIHVGMALSAAMLTFAIFGLRRGTTLHKTLGRIWVGAMGLTALSSFWIFDLRMIGPYSPIHLLSLYTLINLFLAVRAARRGNIPLHQKHMKGLVFGALILAGMFTLIPGRLMHQVLLGS